MMYDSRFDFAFITDPQIGMNSPSGLDGADSDRKRLEDAIRYVNENDIDFVIFGGDQINDPESTEQLEVFQQCLTQLTVPYYGVAGNHDQIDPSDGPSPYLQQVGMRRFAFSHKQAYFMGLDATCWRGDYGIDLQQNESKRFESMILQADAACAHRFLFMHWPLIVKHPDEEDTYWNMPNRREILASLKKHRISCVICGHWHQDIDADWEGMRLVGSIGTSRPIQYPEEPAFKVFTVFDGGWLARRVSVSQR
ncbi:MAG: hypothetical protein CMJ18_04495 [Phycisphaeraceae bacterium]|nr:hypothetical protein [Phycisphaeraceae bacterium]